MISERDALTQTYRDYGDAELIERWLGGNLTELALEVARAEFARRGLLPPERIAASAREDESKALAYVTVATSLVPAEIATLRARLEAEGIPAVIADEGMNRMISIYAAATGGARLMVAQHFALEAQRIIAYVRSGRFELREGESEPTPGPLPKKV
jgi:hypothetical protein